MIILHHGRCEHILPTLAENSFDSIVCDPPYGLKFMGQAWDHGVPSAAAWADAYRVLKPGGYLLAFAGSRTYHRMACNIEDAGFEIRDQIMWVYGSGFPKSLDISKALDKADGAERFVVTRGKPVKRMIPGSDQDKTGSWIKDNGREFTPTTTLAATKAAQQWEGWGTALKPAHEPIVVARKPLIGTVVANVLEWGVGGLNIDGCRVGDGVDKTGGGCTGSNRLHGGGIKDRAPVDYSVGRFPANLIHDGSAEVLALFPDAAGQLAVASTSQETRGSNAPDPRTDQSTSAARFFQVCPWTAEEQLERAKLYYCAKASKSDRGEGNDHPTVKPRSLMRYLCRLVTPPGGVVLDHYAGSGSTGLALRDEGFRGVLVEEAEHNCGIIRGRLEISTPEILLPAVLDEWPDLFAAY